MKNNDEKRLSQFIFGHEERKSEESTTKKTFKTLNSSFQKWKMIFWEENLLDGTCVMTDYTARLFGVNSYCENFPHCIFGKGTLSQQTEMAFRRAEYRLKAGEEQLSFEAVVNGAGDMPKWLEISYCLEHDEEGIPIYAIGTAHDISSKKMLEQKYDDQIAYRNGLCANTLNCMRIDLTEDRITEYNTPVGEITEMCALFPTADACLRKITEDMVRKSDIDKYKDILTTEGLRDTYNKGNNQVVVEYYDTMLSKWLQINFVILKNPSNSHIDCFGICNDISENKLLEIALNSVTKQDYTLVGIIDTLAKEYLCITDSKKGQVVNSYDEIEEVSAFIIDKWKDSFDGIEELLAKEKVFKALEEKKEYSITFNGKSDDRRYQVYFSIIDEEEQLIMIAIRDITDDALLDKLRYDAEHDALTGLYNREKAFKECNDLLNEHPNQPMVVAHFDIQKFRLYNSFFGEAEGDKLLIAIGDMFRELRKKYEYGVYGRIDADVYILCFPYTEDLIEENRKFIREYLLNYRADFQVTGNCGIYIANNRELSAEAMFNRASIVAKDNVNKQLDPVKIFDESAEYKLKNQHQIAMEMQKAIDEKQFVVYLQPKYKLFNGEPFGAEALVRWVHPTKGIIMPGDFIPLFESNGFIIKLDQYMWEETCILLRKWIDQGKNPDPISVNVSRVSMYSPQTVPFLKDVVTKYNISPELLSLELTESAYMDAPQEMIPRLEELRSFGFQVMMDDFGSGYSSLNTLREIPVDYLKMDRVFLASVEKDNKSRELLASIVHMASRMGMPVITEGVETEAQREFLVSIGCDFVQGFLYAKPMPVADYEEKIIVGKERYKIKENNDDFILETSMNLDSEVQKFANLLPHAIAFVEFVGDKFSYLSANEMFLQTFGMHKDIMDMLELINKHVSEEDYIKLRDTYKSVAESKKTRECYITWTSSDLQKEIYLVKVQYVGKSTYSTIMTSSFINLTSFCDDMKVN